MNIVKLKNVRISWIKIFVLFLIMVSFGPTSLTNNIILSAAAEGDNPGLRTGQKMVYNPIEEEIILYGGNRGNGDNSLLESVWKYNISQSEWTEINPEVSPVARHNHGMVYLPENHSIIIFGGRTNSHYTELDDTWKFDLITNTWEELTSTSKPPARQFSSMVFDSQNKRVLLFGGFLSNEDHTDDLWEYSPQNNTWKELEPIISPQSRYGHSMIYRSAEDKAYLFGGRTLGLNNDLWGYDSNVNTWSSVSTYSRPIDRYFQCMEYSSESDLGFLFGGDNENTPGRALDDTWVYNFTDNSWTEIQPETSPPERLIYSMCYDSTQNDMYVYGGLTDDYTATLDDFWKFDIASSTWNEVGEGSNSSIRGYWGLGIGMMTGVALCTFLLIKRKSIHV